MYVCIPKCIYVPIFLLNIKVSLKQTILCPNTLTVCMYVCMCVCYKDILIVTPEKWDSISRGWQKRNYVSKVP